MSPCSRQQTARRHQAGEERRGGHRDGRAHPRADQDHASQEALRRALQGRRGAGGDRQASAAPSRIYDPLAEAGGATRGDGLTILRAESAAAARKIAEADPFVVNGLRSFELREWTVMEGSLGIKVNFSDQSLELA
jgi:hypothetical protein